MLNLVGLSVTVCAVWPSWILDRMTGLHHPQTVQLENITELTPDPVSALCWMVDRTLKELIDEHATVTTRKPWPKNNYRITPEIPWTHLAIDLTLHRSKALVLSSHMDRLTLAKNFCGYFTNKITSIRQHFLCHGHDHIHLSYDT